MQVKNTERRLTTILAADAVGYSALMAQDEEGTVGALKSYRELIDGLISRHSGRIFNTAGDAVIAEFGSAVEAVRCAISIQEELKVRNAELIKDHQMLFRIGINVGDVIVDGDNLLGDGVNIAARLEGISQPGGICISGSTFDQVKRKISIGFEDMGPQKVKNIPEILSAYSILLGPAEVIDGAETTVSDQVAPTAPKNTRRMLRFSAFTVSFFLFASLGIWHFSEDSITPLTAFPENISTTDMNADDIKNFMTGMSIIGIRVTDNAPFSIKFNPNMTVTYEFAQKGELSGNIQNVTGKWRTKDKQFCFQVGFFAKGREICPEIKKTGLKLEIFTTKGKKEWALKKTK